MNPPEAIFSTRLLAWWKNAGRRALPWQQNPTPYRVWISEIMLQQTQVKTVMGYYQRFMDRFPTAGSLAAASMDEVLHLWSGLGYYSRARNLHRAARIVTEQHSGELPLSMDALQQLPGIGRSTAGAILALACNQRHPILDGNVKRVLARFHGVQGWPGKTPVTRKLWALADEHTPYAQVANYTQAIMDLGATTCTRTRPECEHCPLRGDCYAYSHNCVADLPTPRPRKVLPTRETVFIILRQPDGSVLLEQRPPTGVWGGLWSFPECAPLSDLTEWCLRTTGAAPRTITQLPRVRHTFSHFHLDILPALVEIRSVPSAVMEPTQTLWYNRTLPEAVGLAAPVDKLLSNLNTPELRSHS